MGEGVNGIRCWPDECDPRWPCDSKSGWLPPCELPFSILLQTPFATAPWESLQFGYALHVEDVPNIGWSWYWAGFHDGLDRILAVTPKLIDQEVPIGQDSIEFDVFLRQNQFPPND